MVPNGEARMAGRRRALRVSLMKPTRRTQKRNLPPLEKTGARFRPTVPGSLNAPGRTESNWASPPKLSLEEQNQRAADFHRQQSERRARAAEEYVDAFTKYVERQSGRTPRKKPRPCVMCSTPTLDGEESPRGPTTFRHSRAVVSSGNQNALALSPMKEAARAI